MHLVSQQLSLFPDSEPRQYRPSMDDLERDRRSGGQWLRSIKAYLEFGAGNAWRRMSDPVQRWSPEREWYLNGIRCLNGIGRPDFIAAEDRPRLTTVKTAEAIYLEKLTAMPRAWLVDELMRSNPVYTNRKLIAHFTRIKLALLLMEARENCAAALERTA